MKKFFTRINSKAGLVLLVLLCVDAISGFSQVSISGVITDRENDEPLPGVTTMVKGTTTGTVSDAEGRYTLDAPALSSCRLHIQSLKQL